MAAAGLGSLASLVIGGGLLSGGLGLTGHGASKRRRELQKIADTPGVGLGNVYGDATSSGLAALPGIRNLTSAENQFSVEELNRILNQSIPGFDEIQRNRAETARSLSAGEIPDDVSKEVFRSSAGRALTGGYGGSQFGRFRTARDLGLTSLGLRETGSRLAGDLIGSTPMPKLTSVGDFMIRPGPVLNLRSGERAQKLGILSDKASLPTSSEIWGQGMMQMGSSLMGTGLGGFAQNARWF